MRASERRIPPTPTLPRQGGGGQSALPHQGREKDVPHRRRSEEEGAMQPVRVLTWHVHGNYLLYLSQADVQFFLPARPHRPEGGYGGRGTTFPFGANVIE